MSFDVSGPFYDYSRLVFFRFNGNGSWGQLPKHLTVSRNFLQHFGEYSEVLLCQPRDVVSSECPGSAVGASSQWNLPGTPP